MILAAFPTGVANITVNGLHQWDYGQQLKIKASDLPALIEVHFACVGMDEAIVRPCSMVGGEGTVAIPDKCLEQTSPIHAWIYEINGTTGATTKTIVLNILERTRPQTGEDIPVEISNQYTEAVTAMNEAVEAVESAVAEAVESAVSEAVGKAVTAVDEAVGKAVEDLESGKTIVENSNYALEAITAEKLDPDTITNNITKPGLYVASFHLNDISEDLSYLQNFCTATISIPFLDSDQIGSTCYFTRDWADSIKECCASLRYDSDAKKLRFHVYDAEKTPGLYETMIAACEIRVIAYY